MQTYHLIQSPPPVRPRRASMMARPLAPDAMPCAAGEVPSSSSLKTANCCCHEQGLRFVLGPRRLHWPVKRKRGAQRFERDEEA